MSKNKDRSKGFDSLRQRMQDAEQNAVDRKWNVPSESVWKKIQSALPARNRRWLAILPWFLLAGALLLSFTLWDQKNDLRHELHKQLGLQQAKGDSLQMALRDCRDSDVSQQQARLTSMNQLQNKSEIGKPQAGEGFDRGRTQHHEISTPSPSFTELFNRIDQLSFPRSQLSANFFSFYDLGNMEGKNKYQARPPLQSFSLLANASNKEVVGINKLDGLKIQPFWISKILYVHSNKTSFGNSKQDNASSENPPWSIRFYGGYGLTKAQVSGIDLPTSEALGLNIMNGISYGFEALINRNLSNRWSISSGISYQDLQATTDYQVDLMYDPTMEIKNANGNFHLDFEHSIPSAAGNIDLNFGLLRLENDLIQTGETLPFSFQANQHFHYLGIPAWLHYKLIKKGNFSLELSTGYRLDYLMTQSSNIREFKVGHARLHNRYAFMESMKEQYSSFSSQLLFGIDAEHLITQNIGLRARLRSSIPLNQLYEVDGTTSRLWNYDLSLGIAYRW